MIQQYPQLLQYNVDTTMRPKLEFLQSSLTLSRRQDAAQMVSAFPPILWLRAELLQEKMNFLKTVLELDTEELRFLLTSFPQVLGLSVDQNLQPTLEFLLQHLDVDKLREFLAYQPSLLAYSLEKRLRPRIELLQENSISFAYSPPYLMSLTDAKFQQW
jgi:mTERF domain-containing protein